VENDDTRHADAERRSGMPLVLTGEQAAKLEREVAQRSDANTFQIADFRLQIEQAMKPINLKSAI
jgi:hypothetical protein